MILSKPITSENIFGQGIEKSGSIIRGFTVGTNRDFTLQSGLRLQLSGKLSEDIDIVASLTDENSPIQPEGNTESLEEIDKVYIQIKHKNATGIFGDYDLNKSNGEFGRINKKLQGLYLDGRYSGHEAGIAFASSKGKFNTLNFNGNDGVQGPYQLSGAGGERDIIVIAGSEKVFIDGEELSRGENNDYIIDYSLGQITFTPKKLITNQSRIYVDFEYTDRKFTRNIFSGNVSSGFFSEKLKTSFLYLREGDDQDAPIDFILSETDKKIIRESGDNLISAAKSGVALAGPDSNGVIRGLYERVDTTIGSEQNVFYRYNPGTDSAKYTVTFSFVGFAKGDYAKESLGIFRYVGSGKGEYLPIIFLPLPELKQFANFTVSYNQPGLFSINAEFALSSYDRNRLSSLDDNDNNGTARNFLFKTSDISLPIFIERDLKVALSYRNRFTDARFVAPERFSNIEFNRDYNLGTAPGSTVENLDEISAYIGIERIGRASILYGRLKKGEKFQSDRFRFDLNSGGENSFKAENTFDYVSTTNYGYESKWIKNNFILSSAYSVISPFLKFRFEDKKDQTTIKDSLLPGSLFYYEAAPGLELFNNSVVGVSGGLLFREDRLPLKGVMETESYSSGYETKIVTRNIKEINADFGVTFRKKKYSEKFRLNGALDNESLLIRNYLRYNLLNRGLTGDLFYEVSTQRTAKLERVFVQVTRGTGNYRYVDDLNGNGIRDESEFEPANYDGEYILLTIPGDELIPNIDLKTGVRMKYYFREIVSKEFSLFDFVKALSGEAIFRLEENSLDRNSSNVYFLRNHSLMNDSTTIRGNNFIQNDLFVNEDDPDLSFRIRFNQRKSLSQFNSGPEKGYQRERSLRTKLKLVEEIAMQVDIVNSSDYLVAVRNKIRNRKIDGNSVYFDFSYRPLRNTEVGLVLKVGRSEDSFPEVTTIMDNNAQIIRMNISMGGLGRIRAEVERNEILIDNSDQNLPFELTGGNAVGKNYFARFNLDYRIALNLQSTVAYDARKLGGSRIIHNFRGEVRAFF